ncbi:helix-turn-helix transcriptional regulator [bacterium]|nr:helix-turn-helix transcriptional regulator [bacterium]
MLTPLDLLARAMREARKHHGLTQRQEAAAVGCDQSYIAQIERNHRPPSPWLARRLEELYELEPGTFSNSPFFRGRPRLSPESKLVKRELRRARPVARPFDYPLARPRFPKANVVYGLENPFGNIRPDTTLARELNIVEEMRSGDGRFWKQAHSIRYDSLTEKGFVLKLALQGAQLVGVGQDQLGGQLQMVCGKKGTVYRRRAPAAFLMQVEELSIACYPQRCVRTEVGHRWPDHLLVVARHGRKMTLIVEINGPQWHRNKARENRRDRQLGVPVYHLCASEVNHPDALARLWNWIRFQFESA